MPSHPYRSLPPTAARCTRALTISPAQLVLILVPFLPSLAFAFGLSQAIRARLPFPTTIAVIALCAAIVFPIARSVTIPFRIEVFPQGFRAKSMLGAFWVPWGAVSTVRKQTWAPVFLWTGRMRVEMVVSSSRVPFRRLAIGGTTEMSSDQDGNATTIGGVELLQTELASREPFGAWFWHLRESSTQESDH